MRNYFFPRKLLIFKEDIVMHKRNSFNLGGLICLIVTVCAVCYILLISLLPCSIGSVLSSMNHWARHWRVLVAGLLPIYVSLVLFGTAFSSIYLGSALQRWLTTQFSHQK